MDVDSNKPKVQGLFQLTHPVHYLDSKSRGITVALTMTGTRAPSMIRLNSQTQLEENPTNTSSSLFETKMSHDTAVQRMIDHAQEVSHWVASEIVSCSSGKSQIAVLSKFLHTAQICKEMRNYSSCMAILDGLENLIIKQLPVWKNLSGKYIDILEDLNNTRMFLKNDARSLMDNKDSHLFPTIPSILLFLLHVQQQEIGGFTLANQMYKWSKMRSICQVIDQIRIFKNHIYGFEPNYELQDILQQRMREFSGQDVHIVASQHDTNYQKMPSGGISAAFRKVRKKVQAK
ncbi:hypothetical protein KUTeg_004791 [Tegillarca granosa]|uniref:Ras-GEF domain-containing protein n=1 Tax=Tegillarca granosa TaxID=220873 RepID=A0ABQ9FLR5_TEGGR|nr:hypothetical protein KUTeg_004791 [Tegillarca granosa]